jgi:hypothetical protein
MPLPKTTNIGTLVNELKAANRGKKKKRSKAQILAIALDQARKSGANIPRKKW